MRIHTDHLTEADIRRALTTEQAAGRIAATVGFKILDARGSRTHAHAYEVQLESFGRTPGDGRRAGNSGSYGAMRAEYDGYAATYDEWGWLLAALYKADAALVCGTVKHPYYADAEDFHDKTALTYSPAELLAALDDDGDPFPYVWSSPRVGRYGAGRSDDGRYGATYRPRTADWYRGFAKLATVAA